MPNSVRKIRRLPGFRFEAVAPAREDVLPRMDVACFIGFASSGPIGKPVAVESAEQFKSIFGNDLPLVWSPQKNDFVYAYLAPTVRSFFRNGGRRCWILRVARLESSAENPLNRANFNYFPLADFARIDFEAGEITSVSPVYARARAKGSWSDDWLVGTAQLSKSLKLIDFKGSLKGEKSVTLEIGVKDELSGGDLLRLRFEDDSNLLLLVADFKFSEVVKRENTEIKPEFGKKFVEIHSNRFIYLNNLPDEILPGENYTVLVTIWSGNSKQDDKVLTEPAPSEKQAVFKLIEDTENNQFPLIELIFSGLTQQDSPPIGSILFTKLKKELLCLQVENVGLIEPETSSDIKVICRAISVGSKNNSTDPPVQVELLTFELRVKKDKKSFVKLNELAFNEGTERFWGKLPTDEELFDLSNDETTQIPNWARIVDDVNFPLAGDGNGKGVYLPVFAAAKEKYLGAVLLPGTKLQRDGLEVFDEELFLDRKLKKTGLENLLNEAEFVRYLSVKPRSLWGIHAVLVPESSSQIAAESSPLNPTYSNYSLDECTIIAVPDAAHRGWYKDGTTIDEELPTPVFSSPLRPEWWHFQDCRAPQPENISQPLWGNFLDSSIRVIKPPTNLRFGEKGVADGKFSLIWKSIEQGKDIEFVLQESGTPKFEFYEEIYRGKNARFDISGRNAGVYFYRVRIEIGSQFSDWSNGLPVRVPAAANWIVKEDFDAGVMLAVQRGLLRMCAARGDLFAILNLPESFGETDSFLHVGTLKTTKGLTAATRGVEPFSFDELRALSFGGIYHPWIQTKEEDFEQIRTIPTDGAVCGVMASRSIERGAWISPANENLQAVLGFAKEVKRESYLDFQENSINLVRREPRGFLVLNSETLSDEADLRQINVRRLLSLLRRLVVRHGAEYVFEPNNERFRRTVERGFTALLDQMFARGAFAGKTPDSSYRVVVGETANDFRSIDQGRFIVELRVAPSLPLKFVTVRLVQAGARSNVAEVF